MKRRFSSRAPTTASSRDSTRTYAAWRDSLPNAPQRPHRRDGSGRLQPVRNAASARNARGKKLFVTHAGGARTLRLAALDGRSAAFALVERRRRELIAFLGGKPTVPQRAVIEHAAKAHLLGLLAWTRLIKTGAFRPDDGRLATATFAYLRAAREERDALALLALGELARPTPALAEYLAAKRAGEAEL